jgi:hypothetical protein
MEKPEGLGLPPKHMTTKMTKKRWGHRSLLTGFAPHQYPRVSNYPMISKNMMDLGLLTCSKNIRRNRGNSNAKFAITPHRCSKVMVEQFRKRNNWKLGGTRKAIHK